MPAELLLPTARASDTANTPYPGAQWFFYASGTSTPQAAFADADLSSSLGSVVTADAAGKFVPIYLDASKAYRGVCKNSTGSVTLHDIDPINAGTLYSIAGSAGSSLVGFLQFGTGATTRDLQQKVRELPYSPEDFGAVGNNSTDDTAAIQKAIDAADAAGGGTVQLKAGTTYKTSAEIVVKGGIRLNMNEAKIRAVLNSGNDAGVSLRSNTIIENGHVEVDSSGAPGSQNAAHAGIRVGSIEGSSGTPGTPAAGDSPTGWIIRNMIAESDKWIDRGDGQMVGASAIQVNGGANNGVIESVTIPDNAFMSAGIGMDWGSLGPLLSSSTYANMNTNRANFETNAAYTTHPNNIVIRNVKMGALSAPASGAQDVGSHGVRLSGCYNITVENVTIASVTYIAFRHTAGDLGFEFAPSAVKPLACKNIAFRNCTVSGSAGELVNTDSYADNVAGASATSRFTGAISGSTLTVSASASGAIAVGHKIYASNALIGTVSSFGSGSGGNGTYNLTGAVATSSTSMTSGYGWLMDPLHETNILFDRVSAKGPGNSSAEFGIHVLQQRGGVIQNCDVSYYKTGVFVEERTFGVKVLQCHVHFNREDGIIVSHPDFPPEGVVVEDCYSHDNGQDTGFADPAGVHIGTSTRCQIVRCRLGNASGTETTQEFGYRLGSGAAQAVVFHPQVFAFEAGGGDSYIQSSDHSITLRTSATIAISTVGQLASPASSLRGARATVTDSNAALTAGIGAIVAGGGSNVVPVFCDGANWRVG